MRLGGGLILEGLVISRFNASGLSPTPGWATIKTITCSLRGGYWIAKFPSARIK